jgi:hypothetical protein
VFGSQRAFVLFSFCLVAEFKTLTINRGAHSKHQTKTQKASIMKVTKEISFYSLSVGGVFIAFNQFVQNDDGTITLKKSDRPRGVIDPEHKQEFLNALCIAVDSIAIALAQVD